MNSRLKRYKDGLYAGIPIVIGYIPIAIAFGILSKSLGISMLNTFLFSLLVFAGASQFMALNLLSTGVGIGQIVLATLLVNFRHFLMSSSLSIKLKGDYIKMAPFIAFGVTDETFSIASFEEDISKEYLLSLELVSYSSWVLGTVIGFFTGSLLPDMLRESIGVALYGMFLAILVPEIKKSIRVGIIALVSGLLNFILNYFKILPLGWNMILSIVIGAILGSFILCNEENNEGVTVYE